ncbi:nuclease-related domain-containing protein [Actinacidiphila glaucinigra]|uniref:nuclease-related domain-containing protein n=1 Tax=Actinacidiphila glaucinigra TaxID=235986 RepID=UPI0033A21B1D
MSDLSVRPWKRYGQDRLYVNLAGGKSVAWLDRRTGEISILVEQYRAAALDALAPHVTGALPDGASPRLAGADPQPVDVPPDHDLALNRPGEALRAKLADLAPGRFARLLSLLGRKSEADSWRAGLAGERAVGAELGRLASSGWRVLHSVPLPRDVDIDHLLIGPGGVFTINTKHHRQKRVWVGDTAVTINRGAPQAYVRKSRVEAKRSAAILERAGVRVEVEPVLVFVGAVSVEVVPSLLDVRVIRKEREVSALGALGGKLSPAQIEAVYAVARDRRNWLLA